MTSGTRNIGDGPTVAVRDELAPGIGEIIGGSQREERLEILDRNMSERGIDREHYAWYRDLRRYGTVPHAGFGLGFERTLGLRDRPRQCARRHPPPANARKREALNAGRYTGPDTVLCASCIP